MARSLIVCATTVATLLCLLYVAHAVPLQREVRDVAGEASSNATTVASSTTIVPTVKKNEVEICYNNSACGWEIYIPISKEIVDYMSNACVCHELYHCIRWDDNISLSAYIYECRIKSEKAREPSYFA